MEGPGVTTTPVAILRYPLRIRPGARDHGGNQTRCVRVIASPGGDARRNRGPMRHRHGGDAAAADCACRVGLPDIPRRPVRVDADGAHLATDGKPKLGGRCGAVRVRRVGADGARRRLCAHRYPARAASDHDRRAVGALPASHASPGRPGGTRSRAVPPGARRCDRHDRRRRRARALFGCLVPAPCPVAFGGPGPTRGRPGGGAAAGSGEHGHSRRPSRGRRAVARFRRQDLRRDTAVQRRTPLHCRGERTVVPAPGAGAAARRRLRGGRTLPPRNRAWRKPIRRTQRAVLRSDQPLRDSDDPRDRTMAAGRRTAARGRTEC